MFVEGKSRTVFFLQTLLFTAFVVTVQKFITYAIVSTWFMHPRRYCKHQHTSYLQKIGWIVVTGTDVPIACNARNTQDKSLPDEWPDLLLSLGKFLSLKCKWVRQKDGHPAARGQYARQTASESCNSCLKSRQALNRMQKRGGGLCCLFWAGKPVYSVICKGLFSQKKNWQCYTSICDSIIT